MSGISFRSADDSRETHISRLRAKLGSAETSTRHPTSEAPATGSRMPKAGLTSFARRCPARPALSGCSVSVTFCLLIYWRPRTALGDRIDQDLAIQRRRMIAQAELRKKGVAAQLLLSAAVAWRVPLPRERRRRDDARGRPAAFFSLARRYQDVDVAADTSSSGTEPHLIPCTGATTRGGGS